MKDRPLTAASNHFATSKKWAAAILGTSAIALVYATGFLGIVICPAEKAQHLFGLANMATIALSSLITTLVVGQSCVDWRHGSSTQQSDEDRHQVTETIERTFAPKHFDDETLS